MKKSLKALQQGFTLVELVVILVVIGILAAIAIPKYLDLSSAAQTAAYNSTKAAIEAASSINYAASATGSAAANVTHFGTGGATCGSVINGLLQSNIDTTRYAVSGSLPAAGAPDGSVFTTCELATNNVNPAIGPNPVSLIYVS